MSNSNSPQPKRKRLELSPVMWVAIALVALLAAQRSFQEPTSEHVLNLVGQGRRIPVRRTESIQSFETLGIRVGLPDGWSLLATSSNDRSTRPTFVNEAEGCIVRFFPLTGLAPEALDAPNPLVSAIDEKIQAAGIEGSPSITEWGQRIRTLRVEVVDGHGGKLSMVWNLKDPRRIGRWRQGQSQVGLEAVTHGSDEDVPAAVRQLCAEIEPLEPAR